MTKKNEETKTICEKCKYFDGICKHKSNIIIQINKRIEKEIFKSTELKTECNYFE